MDLHWLQPRFTFIWKTSARDYRVCFAKLAAKRFENNENCTELV